ncbi:MAG: hypothetical protein SF051_07870 [Elusimicrobiota bacterium]|nr:hypothetical protein [Elusimicrobiota bacterium]
MSRVFLSAVMALAVSAPVWGAGGVARGARGGVRAPGGGVASVPLLAAPLTLPPTLETRSDSPRFAASRAALMSGAAMPAFTPAPADAPEAALAPPVSALPADAPVAAPVAGPVAPAVETLVAPQDPAGRPRLIATLAEPLPQADAGASVESAASSEADFMARAQLGAPVAAADATAAPLSPVRAFTAGLTPAGRARLRATRAAALATQADAARAAGADAVLAAYEDGSLAARAPELAAALDAAAEAALREQLAKLKFRTVFLYGGFTGTHIYESDELPGLILKIYKRPLDLLNLPSGASHGYALAKAKLGGLFAETSIVTDAVVEIDGRRGRYGRVLVQERAKTKNVANWAERAQATMDALERRGVRDTDTGPRRGMYEYYLSRNLGEAPDGSLVHFDADWFKSVRGATEPARRVPDPKPLRPAIRLAQRRALAGLWATPVGI